VYTDLQEKQRRANNIIVSGLKNTDSSDEKSVVAGMIWSEFGREVTIKHCRRLGKKLADRTQNLLVTLSSAVDAAFLVNNARSLRLSANDFVRRNIYINADLTPAEALAAYETRCARRQRRAEMQARKVQREISDQMTTDYSPVLVETLATSTAAASTTETTSITASTSGHLDPTTPSFTPLTVNAEVHRSEV
jgi:hypothetical protein